MIIKQEMSLRNFKFWSGAKERAKKLSFKEFDTVEAVLEELYPDGLTETEINDLFWFDFDTIAEWLGYEDEEDFDSFDS